MSKILIPEDLQGKALFNFLVANKAALTAEKKYNVKHADAFYFGNMSVTQEGKIVKGFATKVDQDATKMDASVVINTTNWFDSHKDVHLPGLWKKSLSENRGLYHLQEHEMTFRGIITDEVKGYTRKMLWRELGVDAYGETEALIFDSLLYKSRNEFMFNEYRLGRVKNHSVGMRYVVIEMAINDEDYKEEFAVYNKYIDQIVNKSEAEEAGYFWAVKEAKVIEGSAVPIGSNRITPTLYVKGDTDEEPSIDTQKQPSTEPEPFDVDAAIRKLNFIF